MTLDTHNSGQDCDSENGQNSDQNNNTSSSRRVMGSVMLFAAGMYSLMAPNVPPGLGEGLLTLAVGVLLGKYGELIEK